MPQNLKKSYKKPGGTRDFSEKELEQREFIEKEFFTYVKKFGFERISLPYFEESSLFVKSLGSASEVIQKEIYELYRGKRALGLALRPEFTASVARYYLEKGLTNRLQPVKLSTSGTVFRHDRPQKGRFRDPYQLNLEIIGSSSAFYDALIIFVSILFLKRIGIKKPLLLLSSIGCENCQPSYLQELIKFLLEKESKLCPICRERLKTNPLRTLDCKNPSCQNLYDSAPEITNYLCNSCGEHFFKLKNHLKNFGLNFTLDKKLVRGFDYYTKTVFEILEAKNSLSLAGGGRYDNLIYSYSGLERPAVGVGLGLDRILEVSSIRVPEKKELPKIALIALGVQAVEQFEKILPQLLKLNMEIIDFAFEEASLTAKLKRADRLDADFTLIIGEEELKKGEVILKEMQKESQVKIALFELIQTLEKLLSKEL